METEKHKRLTIKHAAALCFAVYAVILVWQCIQRPAKQREETLHRGEMILVSLCVLLFFAYAICRLLFAEVF